MRIVIDYTTALAQVAGVGRYTRSLVAALARVDQQDDFVLFSSERPRSPLTFPSVSNVHPRVAPIGNRWMTLLWQRARVPLPVEVFTGRASVLHAPDFTLPPTLGMRRIVTIHDVAFLTHPECAVPSLVAFLSAAVPRAVKAADRIVAVSERTALDLVERLGVPRAKVDVVHLGADPMFVPVRDAERLAAFDARYGLEHPLALAVGTIEPRKNYPGLIAAFAAARRAPGGPRMLAIAGRKGWLWDATFAAVEEHGVADTVRFLDYVPEADLPTLYSTADVVAMPSLYEGFGLPVVEAMACGTPAVCSDGGSLPEVAGDAALVVAVGDVVALSDAMVRVVNDDGLRARLVARGLERAKTFTWEAAAQAMLRVYRGGQAAGDA
jgi:glycosyltransferase involved in cell wall biosynthesis